MKYTYFLLKGLGKTNKSQHVHAFQNPVCQSVQMLKYKPPEFIILCFLLEGGEHL